MSLQSEERRHATVVRPVKVSPLYSLQSCTECEFASQPPVSKFCKELTSTHLLMIDRSAERLDYRRLGQGRHDLEAGSIGVQSVFREVSL